MRGMGDRVRVRIKVKVRVGVRGRGSRDEGSVRCGVEPPMPPGRETSTRLPASPGHAALSWAPPRPRRIDGADEGEANRERTHREKTRREGQREDTEK